MLAIDRQGQVREVDWPARERHVLEETDASVGQIRVDHNGQPIGIDAHVRRRVFELKHFADRLGTRHEFFIEQGLSTADATQIINDAAGGAVYPVLPPLPPPVLPALQPRQGSYAAAHAHQELRDLLTPETRRQMYEQAASLSALSIRREMEMYANEAVREGQRAARERPRTLDEELRGIVYGFIGIAMTHGVADALIAYIIRLVMERDRARGRVDDREMALSRISRLERELRQQRDENARLRAWKFGRTARRMLPQFSEAFPQEVGRWRWLEVDGDAPPKAPEPPPPPAMTDEEYDLASQLANFCQQCGLIMKDWGRYRRCTNCRPLTRADYMEVD